MSQETSSAFSSVIEPKLSASKFLNSRPPMLRLVGQGYVPSSE